MKERLRWRVKARDREVGVEKERVERIGEEGEDRPFSRLPVRGHSGSTELGVRKTWGSRPEGSCCGGSANYIVINKH